MPAPFGLEPPLLLFTSSEENPSLANTSQSGSAVLLLCEDGPDVAPLRESLLAHGLRLIHSCNLGDGLVSPSGTRHLFIELRLAGAQPFLSELVANSDSLYPIAIVEDERSHGQASLCGAAGSITRPLSPSAVLGCIERNRTRLEQLRQRQERADRERQVITASALDRVLQTLGYELRSPLATALANVEYLSETEANTDGIAPLDGAERRVLLTDTLDSLQRLRITLDGLEALLCSRPGPRQRISVLQVVQRVVDDLPTRCRDVELACDGNLTAWGDEKTLVQIVTTLVRGALGMDTGQPKNRVTIHAYGNENEAKLTIRGVAAATVGEASPDPPSSPTIRPSDTTNTTSALVFAMLHHAVVSMGGTLTRATPEGQLRHHFRLTLKRV